MKIQIFCLLAGFVFTATAYAKNYTCTAGSDAGAYTQELRISDQEIKFGDKKCGRVMDEHLPYLYLCSEGYASMTGIMVFEPRNLTVRYSTMMLDSQPPYEMLNGRYYFKCTRQ